jgi:hypothetical protein
MAGISGLDGMTVGQVVEEVRKGARFVYFQYCISVLILTFRRSSPVFFIKSGESRLTRGLPYSALSFVLGWWGFPWGFIYTPMVLFKNFGGGEDVTEKVMASITARSA